MKKLLCVIIALTTVLFCILSAGCKNKDNNQFQSGNANGLEGSILDWAIIPDEDDSEAMIELAVKMFDNANELYKSVKYCKYSTYGNIKAGVTCERYIFNVKNDTSWYFSEAQYSESAFINAVSKPFLTLKYGTLDYGKSVVLYSEKDISVNKETGVPFANLSEVSESEEELPNYHESQEGKHIQTDFVITTETVKSASITHNDEEGFFTVTIELDVENETAIEKPWADLKENAKDAKYTSCTEIIEIWDSGHYKFFNAIDKWTGRVGIKINATIDYKTYFTYNMEECNLSTYFGYDNLIALINKE